MNQEEFYTLPEVMYLFNKSKSTIIRETNAGAIPYKLEPGKKRGKQYPKQAIDVLVERQKQKGPPPAPRFIFSSSTINDLWSEIEIGRELYGENDIVPYNILLDWRDSNPKMFMSLKDTGQVIAYASLMPLDEKIIRPLLEDHIREKDIPLTAIQPWTNPQLSVYIASVTAQPTGNHTLDTIRGDMILRHTLRWALTVQLQYDIHHWYGIGATKEGQKLFETLGFQEIISLAHGARKGYKLTRSIAPSAHILQKMLAKIEK